MKALDGTVLKRFHRDFRRQHPIRHAITAVLQSVEYPANVGSIFRIADAARIEELVLTGITPVPPNPTIVKVGRSANRRVRWRYEEDANKAIMELKQRGYRAIALELAEGSKSCYEYDWPSQICLVAGHEDHGITRATLALCDDSVFIPMWGKGASLNVHVALAISVFHIRYLGLTTTAQG